MKMLSLCARRFLAIAALFALWSASPAWAAAPAASDQAKQTWQLLDYLAVDYGGAVSNGQIQSASEYEEMKEFAATAAQQLAALPSTAALPELQRQARSEEHTSELQSPCNLVCRLLLEKKKTNHTTSPRANALLARFRHTVPLWPNDKVLTGARSAASDKLNPHETCGSNALTTEATPLC